MSTNPYQLPESHSPSPQRQRLPAGRTLEMLRAQRGLMRLLVLKSGIDLGIFLGAERLFSVPFWELAYLLVVVGTSIALSYYVFRGAMAAYGIGFALLLGITSLAPCIGLLVGLMLTADLRDVLRQSGAEVGLLGATREQLRAWQTKAETEALADQE